jgi:hypothetical protein
MLARLPAFQGAFTVLTLILFGWPVVAILENVHDTALFVYLYLVWGLVIGVSSLIARALKPLYPQRDDPDEGGTKDRPDV